MLLLHEAAARLREPSPLGFIPEQLDGVFAQAGLAVRAVWGGFDRQLSEPHSELMVVCAGHAHEAAEEGQG